MALEEVVAEELELFMWLIKSKLMPSFFALVRDRVSSFFHKSSRSRSRFLSLEIMNHHEEPFLYVIRHIKEVVTIFNFISLWLLFTLQYA